MANIKRFKDAQSRDYKMALAEIRRGRKVGCWMWYIFPQLAELGRSSTAKYYGIADLEEAKEYLADAELRGHLLEICTALLELKSSDAAAILGYTDSLKLRSCVTLFREAAPEEKIFSDILDKFYGGRPDQKTLQLLRADQTLSRVKK